MADPWFFLAELPESGARVTLEGAEARHASSSRRLTAGDRITLFDGRGGLASATVERVAMRPRVVAIHIDSRETVSPAELVVDLLCALPKGDRQGTLVTMATQLGMRSLIPLHAERSVARGGPRFAERARRIAIEACKQCRRAHVPAIEPPCAPDEIGARRASDGCCLVADPAGPPLRDVLGGDGSLRSLTIVIGPEGGLTGSELEQLQRSGAQRFSLGPRILRIETAAAASLAGISTLLEPRP